MGKQRAALRAPRPAHDSYSNALPAERDGGLQATGMSLPIPSAWRPSPPARQRGCGGQARPGVGSPGTPRPRWGTKGASWAGSTAFPGAPGSARRECACHGLHRGGTAGRAPDALGTVWCGCLWGQAMDPLPSSAGNAPRHGQRHGSASRVCRVPACPGGAHPPHGHVPLGEARLVPTPGRTQWVWEDPAPFHRIPTAPSLCAHSQGEGFHAPGLCVGSYLCARGGHGGQVAVPRVGCGAGPPRHPLGSGLGSAACSWRRAAGACLLLREPCQARGGTCLRRGLAKVRQRPGGPRMT